jgi:Cu/Ag efflux protein CusF
MMNLPAILAAVISSFLLLAAASEETHSSSPLHIFSGEVKAVDLKARTITIKSHTRTFVFQITDETKISSFRGYVSWDKVRPGQGATVTMRLGEGNKGIAVKIRFDNDADQVKFLALFSARTTRGEMISGIAVSNFVAYEPPAMPINRGFDVGLNKLRMFRLSVRPDGTVASATPYVSFGNEDLDSRSIRWLMKWRFQPNSVTEVRMPVSWVYTYR